MESCLILACAAAVVALVYWKGDKAVVSEKLKRFRNRDNLSCEEFYRAFYEGTAIQLAEVEAADQILTETLGVNIGRCRPTDRFSVELADIPGGMDGSLLTLEGELNDLAQQNGVSLAQYPVTLDDYITLVSQLRTAPMGLKRKAGHG